MQQSSKQAASLKLRFSRMFGVLLVGAAAGIVTYAQQPAGQSPAASNSPKAQLNQPVLIQREKVSLTSPETYRVAVQLEPIRKVTLTAEVDGTVEAMVAKIGRTVDPDFELLRLNDRRSHLKLTQARAAKQVADLKLKKAQISKDADLVLLSQAEVKLAEVEVDLANYDLAANSIRAPYRGTILEIHVNEGERVRAGQPLVTFGDLSRLKCRLPVDRSKAKSGANLPLTIEAQTATGKIDAVTALPEKLAALRDLAVSVAVAQVELDNSQGKFSNGQSVFSQLVPQFPVARVPLESVKTADAGGRMVQVLRENVVRDIAVKLHGQIGDKDIFVSGAFSEHDEVIRTTSAVLTDGMAVQPAAATAFTNATNRANNSAAKTNTGQRAAQQVKPNAGGF